MLKLKLKTSKKLTSGTYVSEMYMNEVCLAYHCHKILLLTMRIKNKQQNYIYPI